MTEQPTEQPEELPEPRPEVPDPDTMRAALDDAVAAYAEPPQEFRAPRPRTLTDEQDTFIRQVLYQSDVNLSVFRSRYTPEVFLRHDGTLDEQALATAVVAVANDTK